MDDEVIAQVGLGVSKYLEQCLSTEIDVLDKEKFEAIPEFTKSDLTISRHLGRGVYSDVFEVGVVVPVFEQLNISLHGTFGTTFKPSLVDQASKDIADDKQANSTPIRLTSRRASRRTSLCSSTTLSSLQRPTNCDERNIVYAMKCEVSSTLYPQQQGTVHNRC